MIILIAQYQVQAGHGDEVEDALIEMADRVETYEPDCLTYQVCRAIDDPDRFLLYEQYLDQEAVETHRNTTHFQAIIAAKVIPLLLNREVHFYQLVAG